MKQLLRRHDHKILTEFLAQIDRDFIVARPAPSPARISVHSKTQWNAIAELDDLVSAKPGSGPRPEPWLVLDLEHPTLFGHPIPLGGERARLFKAFWCLAENAGRVVTKSAIKASMDNSDRLDHDLKSDISKIRHLLLKDIILNHYGSEVKLKKHKFANMYFIQYAKFSRRVNENGYICMVTEKGYIFRMERKYIKINNF